uniref:presenilins-associated rhomboid-like protein, mitochondrial isoform X2 n=1 Tax=Gasterosteus aculeatus aculeatus TaxID=481459 RepID=UPI001A98669D|nr:presenilins-associated rhomboid-like protein, mitochondrial isoform X2 [Gasterosteus aculeatus aculeatus]
MAWRGCVMKWAKIEFLRSTNSTPRATRLNARDQQTCGFRREARRPDPNKGNVTRDSKATPSEAGTPPGPPPPIKVPRPPLFKPLMFTVGFTGFSFGAAAILQYETLKSRVQNAKEAEESEKLSQGSQDMAYWHDWWNQLSGFQQQLLLLLSMVDDFWSSLTEGQRTVTETRCLPMILSSFSHYSVFHMVANMYVLWTFSSGIVSLLGREQFLAVYLSAGVISTMLSYICKAASGRLHPSLGASGAVMAVLAAVCAKMPEAKLGIIFLPMITFTAGNVLKALVAIDTAGLILGWRLFDHAAHLGGALFGIWYVSYGHKLIWRKREPLVKRWHDMRSPAAGGSRPGG